MRVLNVDFLLKAREDGEGKTNELRVAVYECFRNNLKIEPEVMMKHKRAFWSELCEQKRWRLVEAYLDLLDTEEIAWQKRPEFERLLDDCRAGRVDMVLTRNIYRFCPDIETCIETVKMLSQLNTRVDVFFLQEGVFCSIADNMELLTQLEKYKEELSV